MQLDEPDFEWVAVSLRWIDTHSAQCALHIAPYERRGDNATFVCFNALLIDQQTPTRVRSSKTGTGNSEALRQESGLFANPVCQRIRVHCAGLTSDFAAVFEYDESGNATDIETGGRVWIRLRIELRKADVWFEIASDAREVRRHHFAGPAPVCPEVDYDRNTAAFHVRGKIGVVESDRFAGEQRLFALAAFGAVAQSCFRNSVDRIAAWASDVIVIVHFVRPSRGFTQDGVKYPRYKGLACAGC